MANSKSTHELESAGNFGFHSVPLPANSSSSGTSGALHTDGTLKVSINDSFVLLQEEEKRRDHHSKS